MNAAELTNLRRAFGEICRGYSEVTWCGKLAFVAHLTVFDQTDIDAVQSAAYDVAVAQGIHSEKQRLKWLNDKDIWTTKQDNELAGQRSYVENLHKTYDKLPLKIQRDQIKKQIDEGENKLRYMLTRRERAIGLTAEQVAYQKVQYEYIRLSFFDDPEMTRPLFDRADLRELGDEESEDLLTAYVDAVSRFAGDTLQRIALQPFFTNQFHLCAERLYDFFGVPIVDLTIFQANLLSCGQYYHTIFRNQPIPKDIATDPAKIHDYLTRSQNVKSMMAKAGGQAGDRVGIVGAAREDFEAMGSKDGTAEMRAVAAKEYRDGKDAAKDLGYTVVDR